MELAFICYLLHMQHGTKQFHMYYLSYPWKQPWNLLIIFNFTDEEPEA